MVAAAAVLAFVVGSGFLEAAGVEAVVVGSGSLVAAVAAFVVAAFAASVAFSTAAAVKTAAAAQGSNLLKTEELGRDQGVALVAALVALVSEPGSRDASLRQIWKQNYSF
jgi:hypothetical protein